MAKFCPECANPIVENNMPFCPKCGAKLPGTSAEVQPPPVQQPAVQQPTHPSYYTPPVTPPIKILPTSDIESKSNERSFHYSTIFYIVIILDLIISFLSGIISLSVYFDVTSNGYHHPLNIFFPIVFLINLILDLFLLNNMRKSRDSIDSDSCWLKCIFGFLGIFTIISGLYFLIIGIKMKDACDKSRPKEINQADNPPEITSQQEKVKEPLSNERSTHPLFEAEHQREEEPTPSTSESEIHSERDIPELSQQDPKVITQSHQFLFESMMEKIREIPQQDPDVIAQSQFRTEQSIFNQINEIRNNPDVLNKVKQSIEDAEKVGFVPDLIEKNIHDQDIKTLEKTINDLDSFIANVKPDISPGTIIHRPQNPVLVMKSTPSRTGESLPPDDNLVYHVPIDETGIVKIIPNNKPAETNDEHLWKYQGGKLRVVIKKVNYTEDTSHWKNANPPEISDILVADQKDSQTEETKFVETKSEDATDQSDDNDSSIPSKSLIEPQSIEPGNTGTPTKDIDIPTIPKGEETTPPDSESSLIDGEEIEKKRREHNNNKNRMEVIFGRHDVPSDKSEPTISPPMKKSVIKHNPEFNLQFSPDALEHLDSRYYPILKAIEGLTEISTENFTKILIQCDMRAISQTSTIDDINEWSEDVLMFENPLLEIQEKTIKINMR